VKGAEATITGPPVPKARPRFNTKTGRVYTPLSSQLAEDLVASILHYDLRQLGDAEVTVKIEFGFSTRKSGDLDNCAKLVLDAMQKARIIDNDRQVRALRIFAEDVDKGDEYTRILVLPLRSHDA
jgi:Holliday junction resolvase RusA-like endonuclease